MSNTALKTLTLREAAKICKMNHECFRQKVRAGEIPGAKIGKSWVFIEEDLLHYIRSRYSSSVEQSGGVTATAYKEALCHSIDVEVPFGGLATQDRTENAYRKALEPEIAERRNSTMTCKEPHHGTWTNSATSRGGNGKKRS